MPSKSPQAKKANPLITPTISTPSGEVGEALEQTPGQGQQVALPELSLPLGPDLEVGEDDFAALDKPEEDAFAELDEPGYKGLEGMPPMPELRKARQAAPKTPADPLGFMGAWKTVTTRQTQRQSIPGYDTAPPQEQKKWDSVFAPIEAAEEVAAGMTLAEGMSSAEGMSMEVSPEPVKAKKVKGSVIPKGRAELDNYAVGVAYRESNNRVDVVNDQGYMGLFQMGAAALVDAGRIEMDVYVKAGRPRTGQKHLDFLANPDNWIKGNKEEFLSDPKLQRELFDKYTNKNSIFLKSKGVITKDTSKHELYGILQSAHLVGIGSVAKMFNAGPGAKAPKDGNGTSARTYYALGILTSQGKAPKSDEAANEYFVDYYRLNDTTPALKKILKDIAVDYSEGSIQALLFKLTGIKSLTDRPSSGQLKALKDITGIAGKLRAYLAKGKLPKSIPVSHSFLAIKVP